MSEISEVFDLVLGVFLTSILIGICFLIMFALVACVYGLILDLRKWIMRGNR
jgi:hypothetical protein